ncbi:methyltransferase type 11 [Ophiobolus disseminans]|uniref:Methyltransferase type 11 n=1 Tax=Ophiobolus disseminans TaxID=1469910 RepID=A0A6A6ZN33_9PLEO|nr:methyltransferase type 11 [Ophiobolus disseminans]
MADQGRLTAILGPLRLIWPSIKFHFNALKETFRRDGLAALTHPRQIRDAAIANLFITTSDGFVAYENTTVVPSLMRAAHGKILELGPGSGNQVHRYDLSRVDTIYGVEPSSGYADAIAAKLKNLNLQDKYKLLQCGIEDSNILRSEEITEGSLDTVLSIQVLCSVKDTKSVMREVWKLLKPGGSFVFWEHVKSKDSTMAVAQACWNPVWSAFVGCHMNRDIMADILAAGEWETPGDIEVADDPYTCLPRIWGVLKKKA